jgi:hypothetical protein
MAERPMGGRAPSGSVKSINPWQSVMQTGERQNHGLNGLQDFTDGGASDGRPRAFRLREIHQSVAIRDADRRNI